MVKRTFDPGFRIELHQKDLNLALSARAGARRVAAQHGDGAGAYSMRARRTAARQWDHSAMVRALELLANFEIGRAR